MCSLSLIEQANKYFIFVSLTKYLIEVIILFVRLKFEGKV